ncbi:MAG TPA: carbohydrate kinase [Candidatus Mediterraneibacter norfolkensis]|nr:carbohydrate kinase [Candidatus Mediterraneibacter norfolkensis]
MSKYYIGIDNGGSYIKAALYDECGRQIKLEKEPSIKTVTRDGRVELDPEKLWKANCRCVKRLIRESGIDISKIECMGVAGQGKGLYIVDKEGKPVRPAITSADGRAWEIVKRWKESGVADKIFDYTYQGLFASHPVSILAWLKQNERTNYDNIHWVFSMKDFLVYRMTGQASADYCNQSGNSYMNLNTGMYEPEIFKLLGIEEIMEKLPPLKNSDEICGELTCEAAQELGCRPGIKVMAGMFDVDASALGMGIIGEKELAIIAGTCGINAYISKKPVCDHSVLMNSYYCIPGYYYIEEGSNTSAGLLEWVLGVLYPEEARKSGEDIYKQADLIVQQQSPDSSSVLFMPFLYGSALNSRSRGMWAELSPSDGRKEMLRAAYEGIVFTHKWHIERLLKNRELPDKVRLSGGVSRSSVWTQLFADILQFPVEIVEDEETGVRGVAMMSGIACSIYSGYEEAVKKNVLIKKTVYPQREFSEIYKKKYISYLLKAERMNAI